MTTLDALQYGHDFVIAEGTQADDLGEFTWYVFACKCGVNGEQWETTDLAHDDWARHIISLATPEQIAALEAEARRATHLVSLATPEQIAEARTAAAMA